MINSSSVKNPTAKSANRYISTEDKTVIQNADIIPYLIVNRNISYSLAPKNIPTRVVSDAAIEKIGIDLFEFLSYPKKNFLVPQV